MFRFLRSYLSHVRGQRGRSRGYYSYETLSHYAYAFNNSQNANIKFSYIRFLRDLGYKLDSKGFFLSAQI